MNSCYRVFVAVWFTAFFYLPQSHAKIIYVAKGGSHTPPYTNWSMAGTNIQAVVDSANWSDWILVSNGVYQENISVTNGIRLEGLNGPAVTEINAGGTGRPMYISSPNSLVMNFRLTGGNAATPGGGAFIDMHGHMSYCHIISNNTATTGGGMYICGAEAAAFDCFVARNNASGSTGCGVALCSGGSLYRSIVCNNGLAGSNTDGGGVYVNSGCLLSECRIYNNIAQSGGGVKISSGGIVRSCLIYSNTASSFGGGITGIDPTIENCTVIGNDAAMGGGIAAANGGTVRNCLVISNSAIQEPDVYLNTANAAANYTGDPLFIPGTYQPSRTSPCVNAGTNVDWMNSAVDMRQNPRLAQGSVDIGAYEYTPVYVAPGGNNTSPYNRWSYAANTVSAALAVVESGGMVLISNGVYVTHSEMTVNKPIFITSVNGPSNTLIRGAYSHRMISITTNAILDHLCIEQGMSTIGGGVYLTGGGTVQDSEIRYSEAGSYGGGIFLETSGTVQRCLIHGNWCDTYDGGGLYVARGGLVDRCTIRRNFARHGAGVFMENGGLLRNCVIVTNMAIIGTSQQGGGVHCFEPGSSVEHCTIVGNWSDNSAGGVFVSGAATITHSIVYANFANTPPMNSLNTLGSWSNNCTLPAVGSDCVATDPQMVDLAGGDYRLTASSPCVDRRSSEAVYDYDNLPRPLDGTGDGTALADIGAFERLHNEADTDGDQLTDGFEFTYFGDPLAAEASVDSDGDSFINLDEQTCDTDPMDRASYFKIMAMVISNNPAIQFESSANRRYSIEAAQMPLTPSWETISGDEPFSGSGGIETFEEEESYEHVTYRVHVYQP